MLLTLAGSSCSGKTTVLRRCADVAGLVVHDFDEIGVPSTADARWRHRSLQDWIHRVLVYQERGVDVLLAGQSPLGEVLACPSARRLAAIGACLLDVADQDRCRRLERREPGKWDAAAVDGFLGWARWHRGHARDPQDRPEVITHSGWDQMRWDRWRAWSSSDPRWQVEIIDTTGRSEPETAVAVHAWIDAARGQLTAGTLGLTTGWAQESPRRG